MVWRYIRNYITGLGTNEHLINKLAESRVIKRAAQVTAYAAVRILETMKHKMIEFQKEGGHQKLKQVAKDDFKEGTKIVKEMVTYDIPETLKKIVRDLNPNKRRRN